MNSSLLQFCKRTARLLVLLSIAGSLIACVGSGESDVDDNANDPGNGSPPISPSPGPGTPAPSPGSPSPLTVNLGPDITLASAGLVMLNAGSTNGTYFQWEQVSNGTTVNLMNADTAIVSFLTPEFPANTPLETRNITLRLTVSDDNGFQAYDDIIITVPPELQPPPGYNTPPVINSLTNVIASPGQRVELTATAEDAEDGVPTIRWFQMTGPPLGLSDEQLVSDTISFVAPVDPTKIWFVVEARDSGDDRDLTNVLVEVIGNIPPSVNAGGDISATSQQLVTIQGSASDSDGSISQYSWQQISGPAVLLQNASTTEVSFLAPQVSSPTDITLSLTVTDDQGATAEDQVVITVHPLLSNVPPTANAGNDQVANLGAVVALVGNGTDSDGTVESYNWQQIAGPDVSINNANSQAASFTMPADMQGENQITIELTVTDDLGATGTDEVVITANEPPVANAGVNQSVQAGDTVNLVGSATDSDGNVVSYAWSQINGTAVDIVDPSSSTTSFIAPDIVGTVTLRLTVTDNHGAIDTDDVVVSISTTNIPPVADAGQDLVVNSGASTPVVIIGTGSDADGQITAYEWSQVAGPAVNLQGANTDTVSFAVPDVSVTTVITLRLTVTDDSGDTGSSDVNITINASVNNDNNPPQANAGVDQTVSAGDLVILSGNGIDPDGDSMSYQWIQVDGPQVELNNANTPVTSFVAPDVISQSDITLQLTVTDVNGASHTDEVVVTVLPSNAAPVANAGPDQSVNAGDLVSLSGSGNDSDGTINGYQWTQLAGPTVSLTNANSANASFTAPQVITNTLITLRLTVTDNLGATGFDDVVITVNASGGGNAAPVVNAGPDLSVVSGDNVEITGSAVDDGAITVYVWAQMTGPNTLELINSATATVSFIAPEVGNVSEYTLRLTVVDDQGAIGFDDVVVTVNPGNTNAAPVANAGPDLSVTEGETVIITGSGTDIDGSISSYSWTQVSGISVSLGGANTPTVQFTAPAVDANSPITLRLTVTDNLGTSDTDDVLITVMPGAVNVPPIANAGSDVAVNSGGQLTINGSGQDSDGNIASYQWQQISGVSLTLLGINSPDLQVTAPVVTSNQTAVLRLTVTDNLGASAFDDVTVTVQPSASNLPPIADAGPDQDVSIFDLVTLSGTGSDSDGTVTSFQWSQVGGDPVTLNNASTATASFQAPVVDVDTPYTFELTVTDDAGDTASDTVVITVHPLAVLSGTITVASGTQTDSDVNDTSAPYANNDSIASAQSIFNPVVLGGYANVAGEGTPGRSVIIGDPDDYFAISLSANQVINLYIGNTASGANDLDLYLLNQNGNVIDSSVSPNSPTESLSVSTAGTYFINVRAVSGGSNYVLSVGVSTLSSQSNGWRLSDDFKEGDVIVRFKDSVGIVQSLSSRASSVGLQAKAGAPGRNMLLGLGSASQKATALSRLGIQLSSLPVSGNVNQEKLETLLVAKVLAKRSDVLEAGLNYRYYPTAIPNDTNYNLQWHYPSINLPQAWDITTGSPDVIVAVIDTGVLLNHPDLQGQLVPGYDFIADNANSGDGQNGIDSNPNDPGDGGGVTSSSFHGTHVAGTIAAASNNSLGVAGVAWGVKIMPCRAIGINGGLRYDIEQCVRFAAGLSNDSGTLPAQPADIINLSLGGPTNSTNAPAAYRDARNAGVIVVAAAGNDSTNQLFAPAAYNGVVGVSATNINRQLASYSNFGSYIDVAAPGGASGDLNGDGFFDGVLSTGGDDSGNGIAFTYRFAAGTSMAAPHMAGVAALMKSVYPDMTPADFDSMLADGLLTDDLGSPGRDNSYGYGIINAQKAVQAAANVGAPPAPTPPPPAPAVLQVSPTSLNFGANNSTLQLNVVNAGEATLDITAINNDSGGWMTVSPAAVDATGLGSYDVTVSRNGLQEGVYTATITVQSSAGSASVSVIMQVSTNTTADGGIHYIELINMETMELFDRIIVLSNNGTYDYEFPGVPFGMYHIRAGTDLDDDGIMCELGEACGAFPTMDIISQHIIVDGSVDVMTGLDFISEYSVNLPVGTP